MGMKKRNNSEFFYRGASDSIYLEEHPDSYSLYASANSRRSESKVSLSGKVLNMNFCLIITRDQYSKLFQEESIRTMQRCYTRIWATHRRHYSTRDPEEPDSVSTTTETRRVPSCLETNPEDPCQHRRTLGIFLHLQ